jgi:hypothetical protein
VYPTLGAALVTLTARVTYQEDYDRKNLVEKLIEYEGAKDLYKKHCENYGHVTLRDETGNALSKRDISYHPSEPNSNCQP